MKKLLFCSLLCLGALVSHAAPGGRVFYGFNLGSAEWSPDYRGYDCGFVSYPFDLKGEGTVLNSFLPTPTRAVYAGAGIDGVIYACEYEYASSTSMPEPTDFISYNTVNGSLRRIGKWNPEGSSFKPSDMTYSIKDDKLYAIGFENGTGLYEVDRNTGEFTKICSLSAGGTLAADAKGTLYTMTSGGELCTIDVAKGRLSTVWVSPLKGMMSNQSMEFDHTTGLLYWASCTSTHTYGAEDVYMQEIDLSDIGNITMREVGMVGISSRLVALHIPYAENLDAPAAPADVKSVAGAPGSLDCTLTWTNPTESFCGGEIGTLYGLVIKRDGVEVAYIENPVAGASMSWSDTEVNAKGEHRYDIQLINGKGIGAKGTAFQYAGDDYPAPVANIRGDVADDFKSLTLTWDVPAEGAHKGAYDPSTVSYKVVRNDNVVVADNLKEPTVTDTRFVRLLNYRYTIYSVNGEGESTAVSPSFILGPAVEMPFEQTFENSAQISNRWTCIDANNDTYSWMFATDLGHAVFGDFELCAEYITSPTLGNMDDADEWLISPPLRFEAGKQYAVGVSARAYSTLNGYDYATELIDVHFGYKNTIEAMGTPLKTLEVTANETDENTNTMSFVVQTASLPVQSEDAIGCVGLHLRSELMMAGYIQINSIYIGDPEALAVDGVLAESAASLSLTGRTLFINGFFNDAAVYDMAGIKVASVKGAVTDLSSLSSGIYVVSIDGKSSKIVLH